MKTLLISAAAVLLLALNLNAQTYSIDWFKVAGGGGTSTGGVFTVSGTIGQHDAGSMTGGQYALTGGFWGIVGVVPTPGAPLLQLARTATNTVVIWWPSPSTGFVIQQNGDLRTTNWAAPQQTVTDNGTTKSIVIAPPLGNLYYRLKQ